MPFTPFHLGPALLFGLLFRLNVPAVLVGSVILDIEALYLLLTGADYLHGFFHSYLGASIVSLALGLLFKKTFLGFLAGTYSHVFLDSFLYPDMQPFWPAKVNPFLGLIGSGSIYGFSLLAFAVVAAGILLFKNRGISL